MSVYTALGLICAGVVVFVLCFELCVYLGRQMMRRDYERMRAYKEEKAAFDDQKREKLP